MERTQNITRRLDVKGTPKAWRVRVMRTLTKKQQDGLRLALYYFDNMTLDDKEALIEGIEQTLHGVRDHDMDVLKAKAEKSRIPIRIVRLPDPVTVGQAAEVEHGIH